MQKIRFCSEISLKNEIAACHTNGTDASSFHETVIVPNLTVNDFSVCDVSTVFIMLNSCILKKYQNIMWESPEAYSEPWETSKIAHFAKIINGFESVSIFAKRSILDV